MEFLQILLYVLGSIFLVTLIILTIKLIMSIDRVNAILDDVEDKMKTIDEVFSVVDKITDSVSLMSDRIVDGLAGIISKVFTTKKKSKQIKEEMEEF